MNTKTAIRRLLRSCALVLAGVLSVAAPAVANQWAAEGNVALRGTNLTYYPQPDQNQCLTACVNNGGCTGATWIQAGTYNPRDPAMCYLLSAVTERVVARGHVSVVKTAAPAPSPPLPPPGCTPGRGFECDTDRNGSDYSGFELAQANPQLCMDRCRGDNSCRAWTYVKPGVQGAHARCYLKNPAPPATANHCCVSGTIPRIIDQQVYREVNTDRYGSYYAASKCRWPTRSNVSSMPGRQSLRGLDVRAPWRARAAGSLLPEESGTAANGQQLLYFWRVAWNDHLNR